MKHLLSLLAVSALSLFAADPIFLFDGTNLDDWTPRAKGEITSEGKTISIETKANLWLTHNGTFTNFVLEAEAKIPEGAGVNGGLAFRCVNPKGKPKGYQCEVDTVQPGGIYGIGTGGWLFPKKDASAAFKKKAGPLFKKGDWNTFKIQVEGNRFQTWVNGVPLSDVKVEKVLPAGYIAIQHHGKGSAYKYRNMKITVLD